MDLKTLSTKTRGITPTVQDIQDLAAQYGIPQLSNNFKMFDTWFSLLHELSHWLVKPRWYREYAIVLQRSSLNSPEFAPFIPDLQMPYDPTPDEFACREWGRQVIQYFGWENPVAADPRAFMSNGGFNPFHWLNVGFSNHSEERSCLTRFGIDVRHGQLEPIDDGFELPHPNRIDWKALIENWQAIALHYKTGRDYSNLDPQFVEFLKTRFPGGAA